MFGHLTLEERREMVNVLESYTSQQEATPQVKPTTSVMKEFLVEIKCHHLVTAETICCVYCLDL